MRFDYHGYIDKIFNQMIIYVAVARYLLHIFCIKLVYSINRYVEHIIINSVLSNLFT